MAAITDKQLSQAEQQFKSFEAMINSMTKVLPKPSTRQRVLSGQPHVVALDPAVMISPGPRVPLKHLGISISIPIYAAVPSPFHTPWGF